jgi:hypothetical protein
MESYSQEIKKAYQKVIATSEKYDVEFKTPYGKRVLKTTYDTLDKLCKSAGYKTLTVCFDLAAEELNNSNSRFKIKQP